MSIWKKGLLSVLAAGPLFLASQVEAKAVFCHYLLSTVDTPHAQQDIDNAQAMGFDAFALDILDPTQPYTGNTTQELFDYAQTTGFKLFFSMDLSSYNNLPGFTSFIQPYLTHSAYYTGPDGNPFLSTFDAGSNGPSDFASFEQSLGQSVYFVPDFDDTSGYYNDTNEWFSTWDAQIQGAFSWETAWPASSNTSPVNESITQDLYVQTGAQANNKAYMMPLSTFQYKHLTNVEGCSAVTAHYYRVGEVNLPQRMTDILSMDTAPDFVEVITWNDAGEGHYIGNVWDEGLPTCITDYANQATWDHSGWQPLFQSFIGAYKAGGDSTTMQPPSGTNAVGAMWYRTILKDATCANDPLCASGLCKPDGWQSASDAVNWAVVLPSDPAGMQIQVSSGGSVLQTFDGVAGLNYGSVPGINLGAQQVQLLSSSGDVLMTANSQADVAADSDGICNFNYQVAALQ